MLMERIKDFCNQNTTHIIIGGATIVCLGGLIKIIKSKKLKKKAMEKKCVVNENGDVLDYSLKHTKRGYDAIHFSGFPDGFNSRSFWSIYDIIFRLAFRMENKEVNFLNARNEDLKVQDCGFELVNYEEKFDAKEWHLKENQKQFQEEMTKFILEKHPGAIMGQWYGCLFRGGEGQNPPAVDGPHLDSHPNLKKGDEWRRADGGAEHKYVKEADENPTLRNKLEKSKKFKMIGVWKPIGMKNPVLDFPLAIMDTRTWRPWEDCVEFKQDMCHVDDGEVVRFRNLGGHIRHNPEQKWYYYPEMKNDEVLLFTHISCPDAAANPHTSFRHPSAPKDIKFETRKSVESRCMIYWPEEEVESKI